MINHTPLYHELYKFTNEYKNSEAKKLVNKFIFQPSVYSTDGCDFINSNIVYSNELDIIPDAKIYLNTSKGSINKHIKLIMPFSEIKNSKDIIKSLNKYRYNSNTINKLIYNTEFNVKEFYEATGIYILISRRNNDQEISIIDDIPQQHFSSCINSNYKLGDKCNVRLSIKNNSYLEIDFLDKIIDNTDNIYELSLYGGKQNIDDLINYDSNLFDFNHSEVYNLLTTEDNGYDIITTSDTNWYNNTFEYNNALYQSLIDVNLTIQIVDKDINNNDVKKFIFHLYSYEYNISFNGKNKFTISLNPDINSSVNQLINSIDTDKYSIVNEFSIYIKSYDTTIPMIERKNYLEKYSIFDNSYYKSSKITADMTNEDISNAIINDEENLRNSLPFSLEYILNRKSTFNIQKIKKVLYDNIEFRNNNLYIKYTLNSKHDTVMFFRNSKLVNPEFVETNGTDYSIYIPMKDIISNESIEKIKRMKYNIIHKVKYIELESDANFWIVYDTDRHFIENIRYDLKSVYVYVNISNTDRYSISTDAMGSEAYFFDENGEYIKYKNEYLELGSKDYYLDVNGDYTLEKPNNYTGDIYRKTKTNEYLLPLNKDIDPSKIVITIEDYHDDHDDLKYIKDPKGSYIKLEEDRYYQTYNTIHKNGLYVNIDDSYILYNEKEHSEYLGSFYIKKEAGYILPPYYLNGDVRYRKISKKCIVLSNIFNIPYNDEVVAVDSYYHEYDENDTKSNFVIRNKTYNKDSFVSEMLYKKYELMYPLNDVYYCENGEYKLYNSKLAIENEFLLYKKDTDIYISKNEVDNYISEIRNFIDMNRVYKFCLNNKEILNLEKESEKYGNSYITIDAETSEVTQMIFINGSTSTKFVNDEDVDNDIDFSNYNYDNDSTFAYIESDYNPVLENNSSFSYGDILDGGYANTDEYMSIIDGGYSTSFSEYPHSISKEKAIAAVKRGEKVYINIDTKPVPYELYKHSDYDGPFYKNFSDEIDLVNKYNNNDNPDDDYPIYDFNFTSPYTINDEKVKAYRIDSSYSNYFNSDDEFLAFVIPNQLINSEHKLLTFLDGKFTDEFAINKHLYSRLFGGDTLLSFTEDPKDYTGNDYSYRVDKDGKYYFNGTSYEYDPDRDIDRMTRVDDTTYYKIEHEGKIIYITTESYDSNDIESETIYELLPDGSYSENIFGKYYRLKNGNYILMEHLESNYEIESYDKYYELVNEYNNSKYINIHDYYMYRTSYSKNIHNVFVCNMKNLTLYQNTRGITYKDKIFTISNSIDTIVHNDRKLYKDIYFPPLSLKYMLFFINGKFANPYIEIVTPQRFIISDNSFLVDGEEINDIQIYAYDSYLYNLNKYNIFFNTDEYMNLLHGYNIHTYKDTMWDEYSENIIESIKSNTSIKDQIYVPIDPGYHSETSLISLYEIFGKYILNKYDIDNDPTLHDEIREYFAPLFDENNRMKLELIQDQIKRKYIY